MAGGWDEKTGLDVITNKDINEIFGIAFQYLFQMGRDLSLILNSAKHLLGLDKDKYDKKLRNNGAWLHGALWT